MKPPESRAVKSPKWVYSLTAALPLTKCASTHPTLGLDWFCCGYYGLVFLSSSLTNPYCVYSILILRFWYVTSEETSQARSIIIIQILIRKKNLLHQVCRNFPLNFKTSHNCNFPPVASKNAFKDSKMQNGLHTNINFKTILIKCEFIPFSISPRGLRITTVHCLGLLFAWWWVSWTESEFWGKNSDPRCEGAIIDDWFCEHIKHAPQSTNIV